MESAHGVFRVLRWSLGTAVVLYLERMSRQHDNFNNLRVNEKQLVEFVRRTACETNSVSNSNRRQKRIRQGYSKPTDCKQLCEGNIKIFCTRFVSVCIVNDQ